MKLKIALVIVAVLFISIFLHEIGHCLVMRHNGVVVEKVAVGTVWKAKLNIFTDSQGTKYELGPLPVWGYTEYPDVEEVLKLNLAQQAEIFLAGVAANTLFALFLTPWYFWLRRRWQKKGKDFSTVFPGKVFRVFITVNFLMLFCNLPIVLPICDGGQILCLVLGRWLSGTLLLGICWGLGSLTFIWLIWSGFDFFFEKINKIYGWSGWPEPRR